MTTRSGSQTDGTRRACEPCRPNAPVSDPSVHFVNGWIYVKVVHGRQNTHLGIPSFLLVWVAYVDDVMSSLSSRTAI
ncbi:hypothetical protein FG05_30649 [Fusarium graminearum]|nr:hypothetical protein FG05_30649 [Fusarium graminearum]